MYRLYKYSQIPPFSEKWTLVFHFFSTEKITPSPKKAIHWQKFDLPIQKPYIHNRIYLYW